MDLERALDRISYAGGREPCLENLRALQRAFLLSVPFENLDVHWGRKTTVDPAAAYRKIVEERRGGWCYECNGLFAEMLRALGYATTIVSCRMCVMGPLGPEDGHMALLVDLDQPYLVDVGNGESCREPMPLDGSYESHAEGKSYRVGMRDEYLALLIRESDDEDWRARFAFTTESRTNEHFAHMCEWQQTAPESIFTKGKMVTLATDDGRRTLIEGFLKIVTADRMEESTCESAAAYGDCLVEHFGITIPDWANQVE